MSTTATLVSVQEFLRLSDKPAFEFQNGILRQKPLPTWKHSLLQARIAHLLMSGQPEILAGSELTVRVRPGRYLVPDVAAQWRAQIQDPYPTEPIPLCVEVLSPDDRLSEAIAKGKEYHEWGVPMVWIIDPDQRLAWEFAAAQPVLPVSPLGHITAPGIRIQLPELFTILD